MMSCFHLRVVQQIEDVAFAHAARLLDGYAAEQQPPFLERLRLQARTRAVRSPLVAPTTARMHA